MKTTEQMRKELGVGELFVSKLKFFPSLLIQELNALYDISIYVKDVKLGEWYVYDGEDITPILWNEETITFRLDNGVHYRTIDKCEPIEERH